MSSPAQLEIRLVENMENKSWLVTIYVKLWQIMSLERHPGRSGLTVSDWELGTVFLVKQSCVYFIFSHLAVAWNWVTAGKGKVHFIMLPFQINTWSNIASCLAHQLSNGSIMAECTSHWWKTATWRKWFDKPTFGNWNKTFKFFCLSVTKIKTDSRLISNNV